ncbi:MAG TPA: molybdopterin-dependent oxidoreductase, partial [Nitrososphaerales archaeon]|nr:molybdopterin-dependent oxidoreductase [Nitrososphaerales archaeon]
DGRIANGLRRRRITNLEGLLLLGLAPWLLFGLILFPLTGDYLFGAGSIYAIPGDIWAFPLTLLLVQAVFAFALSSGYNFRPRGQAALVNNGQQDLKRRNFIEKGAIGVFAVIAGFMGLSSLGALISPPAGPTGGSPPIDLQDAPAIFRDPRLATLVASEVTPNDAFYRVAIDIIDPTVDSSTWSLTVDGLVNTPKKYAIQDIQSFPEVMQYSTFECVSNIVNGNLISNAKWGGVKISDILANAGGVQSGAQYVVFYSVDGYSVGIPIEKAKMSDSLLAYEMNDQPLPTKHGFPLRGVIPGLYGMMSAKWVTRMSVLGHPYQGYWQTRGWTNGATIYTEAFILVPNASQVSMSQNSGSVILAGYAFAGDRGISKVEVSTDNGKTWQTAQLKNPISNLTWALWASDWHPTGPGEYSIVVRATDGQGQVQTSTATDTFPYGATGYVSATILVTD